MEAAAATRGRSGEEQRLELSAFLSLWLVRFVLPMELSDSTLAPTFSRGRNSPLTSAWHVATTYVSVFHRRFVFAKRTEVPSVLAP
jgi:hypothetical protein